MRSIRTPRSRAAAVALSAGLAFTLAACGGDDSTVSAPPGAASDSADSAEISAEHNDTDIAFINDMAPHHEGALMMTELAQDRAEDPRVKDLADRIAAAQDPEIEQMQAMAEAWGVELGGGNGGMDMDMGAAGDGQGGMGMGMGADAEMLMNLEGAAFDRAFLEQMIPHHEGAVVMARRQIADGENPAAQALAEDIVESQTAEIEEMEQLLTEL